MASIEKRGEKWRVRWRDPDGSPRSRSCPTAAAARELKRDVEKATALGRAWEPEAARPDPELGELVSAWLDDMRRIQRGPRTIERAWFIWKRFFDWLTDTGVPPVLSSLTYNTLASYDSHRQTTGVSIRTRRMDAWAISGAWEWGWRHPDWRDLLNPPQVPTMPALPPPKATAATIAELDAVVLHMTAKAAENPAGYEWRRRTSILLRGLGWRISQVLSLDGESVNYETGEITCREGKTAREKAGWTVPLAPWLFAEVKTWLPRTGPLIGTNKSRMSAANALRLAWEASEARPAVYQGRPDHAFRIGLITHFAEVGAPFEAGEFYVGHMLRGTRRNYVDPKRLPLREVAMAIPPISSRVPSVSAREGTG